MKPVDLLRQYAGALEHDPAGPKNGSKIYLDLEFIAHLISTCQDLAPFTSAYQHDLGLCRYGSPLWQHNCLDCKTEEPRA